MLEIFLEEMREMGYSEETILQVESLIASQALWDAIEEIVKKE